MDSALHSLRYKGSTRLLPLLAHTLPCSYCIALLSVYVFARGSPKQHAVAKATFYYTTVATRRCGGPCRVEPLNMIDGVAPVKAGFDDAQKAAIIAAFDAQPGDLLLLVGGQ